MNEPRLYSTEDFQTESSAFVDGKYVCARPVTMGRLCLRWRLKLAWRVFVGKYDAVFWVGQEDVF